MKKLLFLASLVLAMTLVTSCDPNQPTKPSDSKGIHVFDNTKADSYYSYAEISIPVGVTTVYLENYSGVDEQGHKMNVTVKPIEVKPVPTTPKNGRDVEPFGTVRLLFKAPAKTMVAVYYQSGDNLPQEVAARRNRAMEEDSLVDNIYTLNDFPVDQIVDGAFGETRWVRVPTSFAFVGGDESGERTYPNDVVMYDTIHNHTLRYTFAYEGVGTGYGYVLTDAYYVENHVVTGAKYNYCGGCEDCPYCMPWACSCGCGSVNTAFVPSGDITNGQEPQTPASLVPAGTSEIFLPEPAPYITTDQNQTFYHSSGCVFFEDSWPQVSQGGVYDTDFDDVVIDYDIEAKTVADELLADEGWREQIKVVMHLRAVGSGNPYRVGVQLQGFDQQYVESIEQHFSLDSWQNPHGNLPKFTETTLQKMSGHYETDPLNPVVEIAHIHTMNQPRAGQGADAEYTYENNGYVNPTVFNLTYGYKGGPDSSQYDPALETMPLPYPFTSILKQKYYNAIPGYINVAGGLFTYTVIYHMKPRIDMDPETRQAAKQNMIETVVNTTKQNFYIIADSKFKPVGLKGYDPVLIHSESVSEYNKQFQAGVAAGTLDPNIPYAGTNGAVWGFKCPTLTRHIWNKLYFSQAYPHYEEWITSGGAQYPDWYVRDLNEMFVVCWW